MARDFSAYYQANKEHILAVNKVYREAHKEEIAEMSAEYRRTHKEELRAAKRFYKFGLTAEQISVVLEDQGRQCAICRTPIDSGAHLDHDHATGQIRGLLCQNCNLAIGLLKDDPERFLEAAKYLQHYAKLSEGATN